MALNESIPSKSFDVLEKNMENTDEFVNSKNEFFTNRPAPNGNSQSRTIYGINKAAEDAIRNAGGVPLGDGQYALPDKTYTAYNQYLVQNEVPYKPLVVPYTTDVATYPAAADDPNLQPWQNVSSEFIQANYNRSFDNVSDMKLADLNIGETVQTRGYSSPGDGGQAKYLVVSPQSADEFGSHSLQNGNVAVIQPLSEFNIMQFGATSSGDVTGNVQAAIDAWSSPEGPSVLNFLDLTFEVSKLFFGSSVKGKRLSASSATVVINNTLPGTEESLLFDGCENLSIDGLKVNNSGGYEQGRSRLITFDNCSNINCGPICAEYDSQHLPVDENPGSPKWQLDNINRCIKIRRTVDSNFEELRTINADISIRLWDSERVRVNSVRIKSFMKGLLISGGTLNEIGAAIVETKTPTFVDWLRPQYNDWREDTPGNNGILMANGDDIEPINNLVIENARVSDTGEHGIRFGAQVNCSQIKLINPITIDTGAAGIKIWPDTGNFIDGTIDSPVVIDCLVIPTVEFSQATSGFTQVNYSSTGNTISIVGAEWPLELDNRSVEISGTTSNNGTYTILSRDSDTQITVSGTLTNENDASASSVFVINQNFKNSDGIMLRKCIRTSLNNPIIDKLNNTTSCLNGITVRDVDLVSINNPVVNVPNAHGLTFDNESGDTIRRLRVNGGSFVGLTGESGSGLRLIANDSTIQDCTIMGYPQVENFAVGVNISGDAVVNGPSIVTASTTENTLQVQNSATNGANWMAMFTGRFNNETNFREGSTWNAYDTQPGFNVLKSSVWTTL